jgi:murein DD-endopeptidase MepM/ murein hydrolase activator NlpD
MVGCTPSKGAVAVAAVALVASVGLGATAPRSQLDIDPRERVDGDGDQVPDYRDRCPESPRHAPSVSGGCSAVEIVARPEIVGEAMDEALSRAMAGIAERDGLVLFGDDALTLGRELAAVRSQFDKSLRVLAQGKVCEAARMIAEGRGSMEAVSTAAGEAVLSRRTELQRGVSPDDPDADLAEVAFHELGYRGGLVGNALVAARELDAIGEALCDQVAGPISFSGIVDRTDEAHGVVVLRNGKTLAVADRDGLSALREGALVRLGGSRFKDSTGVVDSAAGIGNLNASVVPDFTLPCVILRVAPFQPFNPPLNVSRASYVVHDLRGYLWNGELVLEAPMRLAAAEGFCPTEPPSKSGKKVKSFRYSLKLEYRATGAEAFETFASDLDRFDHPVALPASSLPAGLSKTGTLRVTTQGQSCFGTFPKWNCSSDVKVMAQVEIPVEVYGRGNLGRVFYEAIHFDIEDWDTTGFRTAEIDSYLALGPLPAVPTRIQAEGYSASGNKTLVSVTSDSNPYFAVHQDDFGDNLLFFRLDAHGVDRRSALRWPRIVGENGGRPFWYSVKAPAITRDLIDFCDPSPHSFYRLPWVDGGERGVGQGNNGSFSHTGSQAFAFDFSLPSGETIRAARGGTVDWYQESQTSNYNPNQPTSPTNQPFPNGSLQNWGNALRIGHQDGTFAWYFHLETDGVHVNLDQKVQRGQPVALADNTGRSGGPHLHFQVQANSDDWGQSIRIRFDAGSTGACYIPEQGDSLVSNNANPNY